MPKRSAHPGVNLLKPRGEHASWRARWVDPDSGKLVYRRLPPTVTTQEARRAWAIELSRRLVARRVELDAGAQPVEPTAIPRAIEAYFAGHRHLRAGTLAGYRAHAEKFAAWCERAGIRKTSELTRGKLLAFREATINEVRKNPVAGGRRGERAKQPGSTRSIATINNELKSVRTIVGYWLDRDWVRIGERELKRALRVLPMPQERIQFYDRDAIAKLPLHEPFVRCALLTGMRLGEVLALDWQQVRLDHESIEISATSKTHRARSVRLDVCPSLIEWLESTPEAKRSGRVFSRWTKSIAADFAKRKAVGWQKLRRTCATFSCALPTLGPWQSAKRLGHSVAIAERHYAGLVRVDPAARTLEAAMGLAQ